MNAFSFCLATSCENNSAFPLQQVGRVGAAPAASTCLQRNPSNDTIEKGGDHLLADARQPLHEQRFVQLFVVSLDSLLGKDAVGQDQQDRYAAMKVFLVK